MHGVQKLSEAFEEKVAPNSKYLPRLTEVSGFDRRDPIVELAAGYMVWTALTASGIAYVCGTGFDGYAGNLPETLRHGGWAYAEQVSALPPNLSWVASRLLPAFAQFQRCSACVLPKLFSIARVCPKKRHQSTGRLHSGPLCTQARNSATALAAE
jgi:hypothetical protein